MSDREQQLRKLALKKKLEIFSFPPETIEHASSLENLQKALDWIFIHGNMGDLTPGKQAPPLPKETVSAPSQPAVVAPPPTTVPSSPSTSKQSTIAQKIIQLENEGYSQEEIQDILKEEKLIKLSSSSSPSSTVVPPPNAPVLDLSSATDEDLAKLLQAQEDAEVAQAVANSTENSAGSDGTAAANSAGSEDVHMTAEKRILKQKEMQQKGREYQERIRKEIAEREKKAERERERARREQGKDVLSQKEKYDQMVIKAQREQREREKNWEKNEMARIRKKIQEDKDRRKRELEAQQKEAQQKKG